MTNTPLSSSRRRFLRHTLAVSGAALGMSACSGTPPDARTVAAGLTAWLNDPEVAAELGGACLAADPEWRGLSLQELTDSIVSAARMDVRRLADAATGEKLSKRVHEEFAAEDVVMVDGWMLARTEARLCALQHVLSGSNAPAPNG